LAGVFGDAFMREGDNELDLARRYTEVAKEIAPHLPPTLAHVFAIQQREELRRAMVDLEAVSKGELAGSEDITVAFADLVGFTRLGESIPPEELGAVAARLGELASEVAEAPVRFVKTIGDAAMLVSYKADPVVKATLALVQAAEDEGEKFPQLRAGLAASPSLRRAGDWYGRPVKPGQQDHRQGPPGHRPGLRGGPGARRGRVRVVVRAQAQDQGHLRRGPVVPRAPRGRARRRLTLSGLDVGALSPLAARAGGANCAYRQPAWARFRRCLVVVGLGGEAVQAIRVRPYRLAPNRPTGRGGRYSFPRKQKRRRPLPPLHKRGTLARAVVAPRRRRRPQPGDEIAFHARDRAQLSLPSIGTGTWAVRFVSASDWLLSRDASRSTC